MSPHLQNQQLNQKLWQPSCQTLSRTTHRMEAFPRLIQFRQMRKEINIKDEACLILYPLPFWIRLVANIQYYRGQRCNPGKRRRNVTCIEVHECVLKTQFRHHRHKAASQPFPRPASHACMILPILRDLSLVACWSPNFLVHSKTVIHNWLSFCVGNISVADLIIKSCKVHWARMQQYPRYVIVAHGMTIPSFLLPDPLFDICQSSLVSSCFTRIEGTDWNARSGRSWYCFIS